MTYTYSILCLLMAFLSFCNHCSSFKIFIHLYWLKSPLQILLDQKMWPKFTSNFSTILKPEKGYVRCQTLSYSTEKKNAQTTQKEAERWLSWLGRTGLGNIRRKFHALCLEKSARIHKNTTWRMTTAIWRINILSYPETAEGHVGMF